MAVDLSGFKERHKKAGFGRGEIAKEVSRRLEISVGREMSGRQVLAVVGEVFEVLVEALKAGKHVEIRGFGTMRAHRMNARRVVSHMTNGRPVRVDARWRVLFKTSKTLQRGMMEHLED